MTFDAAFVEVTYATLPKDHVSKSYGHMSKYVDTVTIFQNLWPSYHILHTWTDGGTDYKQNEWSHSLFFELSSGETKICIIRVVFQNQAMYKCTQTGGCKFKICIKASTLGQGISTQLTFCRRGPDPLSLWYQLGHAHVVWSVEEQHEPMVDRILTTLNWARPLGQGSGGGDINSTYIL